MLARLRGFTLIEALVTLALLGVLASLAAPAMTQLQQAQLVRSASLDLHMAFVVAREAAITRQKAVMIDNQDGDWSSGWQVFVDLDADGSHGSDEPILLVGAARRDLRIAGNAPLSRYVRYVASGEARLRSGAFQAGTLTLCHISGRHPPRRLVLSASGRLRSVRDESDGC